MKNTKSVSKPATGRVAFFITGAHLDFRCQLHQMAVAGASNPGSFTSEVGGAGFNMAACAAQLGLRSCIISPVGSDANAEKVRSALERFGVEDGLFEENGHSTGSYTAVLNPGGDLVIALADMQIYENLNPDTVVQSLNSRLEADCWLVYNTNITADILERIDEAVDMTVPLKRAAATVSHAKAPRLRPILSKLDCLFTNRSEVISLLDADEATDSPALAEMLHRAGCNSGVISNGSNPVAWWQDGRFGELQPPLVEHIENVVGAGDALAGAVLAGVSAGHDFCTAVQLGLVAASETLRAQGPVCADLNWPRLRRLLDAQA